MQTCYPATRPIRATEPTEAQEPITLAQAKKQVGLADTAAYHNQDLLRMIVAARRTVERDLMLACYTGTFVWRFTHFPCQDYFIITGIRPVTSITSIVYTAGDGTSTTWSSSDYALDTNGTFPVVKLAYGAVWPTVRGDMNGIAVTMVAGYATVAAIPAEVKNAVLTQVHAQYKEMIEQDFSPELASYDRQITNIRPEVYA